jgi:hypothetical protein
VIPLLATVRIQPAKSRAFGLWIPLFLLWLVLLPLAVLALPLIFMAFIVGQVNPFKGLSLLWQMLSALKDTHVEVEDRNCAVLIHVF